MVDIAIRLTVPTTPTEAGKLADMRAWCSDRFGRAVPYVWEVRPTGWYVVFSEFSNDEAVHFKLRWF